ncbi:MAG: YqzL family protein [Alkaliphilus sp.]|nr:YqzL family protein [Alkaliphilus sp.]
MFASAELFWKLFMLTGNIDVYLVYKELLTN